LPELNEAPAEVAEVLTNIGLEVETVETFDPWPLLSDKVLIGEVLKVEPHPHAEKLQITHVRTGTDTVRQIICGAPNVAAGQKVMVAMPGARVKSLRGEEITIKRAKLRGAISEGMILAEKEVELGEDAEGIKVLPADAPVGVTVRQWLGIKQDTVFEVALTPNRGDAASHLGIARDLSAYYDRDLHFPGITQPPNEGKPWKIYLPRPEACARYIGIGIEGVRPIPSPRWLQERLCAVGIIPRNVLVDLTNYILMELGQPLHVFDLDRLSDPEITVDFAHEGEQIEALDGNTYKLGPEVLTIRNGGIPVAIAGVVGGAKHSVNNQTRHVFLESAYFTPSTIRQSVRRLGLSTDASFRYERGTDPLMIPIAVARYWHLLRQIFPKAHVVVAPSEAYPKPVQPVKVPFDVRLFGQWNGFEISPNRARQILFRMGFKGADDDSGQWTLEVPPAKHDVSRPVDIVEELLRIEGMDKIPTPPRVRFPLQVDALQRGDIVRRRWESFLIGQGFRETIHNSIVDIRWLDDGVEEHDFGRPVELLNPLSNELTALRTTLIFPALITIRHNLRHGHDHFRLWEWGRVYAKHAPNNYVEEERLALWAVGMRTRPTPHHPPLPADFYYLKGVLDALWRMARWTPRTVVGPHRGVWAYALDYYTDEIRVARLGALALPWLSKYKIEVPVVMAELRWDVIRDYLNRKLRYRSFGRFPVASRDLAVLMPHQMPWEVVEKAVWEVAPSILQSMYVFDVYEGKGLPPGRKSIAFRLHFYDPQQTLQEKDIDQVMQSIIQAVQSIHHVEIRR